jgi:hypothetical protein
MIFDDITFHDSQILQVTENPKENILDILLDFPTNWEENIFENKTLRFTDVIFYKVDEIPFSGSPTILDMINLGETKKVFGIGRNQIETLRRKVEIRINAGNRIIEFSNCNFVE